MCTLLVSINHMTTSDETKDGVIAHLAAISRILLDVNHQNPLSMFETTSRLIRGDVNSFSLPSPPQTEATKATMSAPLHPLDMSTREGLAILRSAGVGFAEAESVRVAMAVSHLKKRDDVTGLVRFWGKVVTKGGHDYYICEITSSDGDELTYFCNVGLGEEWIRLPEAKPALLKMSRRCRCMMTGRLDARVLTHPIFPGTEAEYLSATIARIAAATTVGPTHADGAAGTSMVPSIHCHWKVGLSAFCHTRPAILESGLTVAEDDDAGNSVNVGNPRPRLNRPLDKDQRGTWTVRYMGDPNVYTDEVDEKLDLSLGTVLVSSRDWVGAHYVLSGYRKQSCQIYVGTGLKQSSRGPFDVEPPNPVCSEPDDSLVVEQAEPVQAPAIAVEGSIESPLDGANEANA